MRSMGTLADAQRRHHTAASPSDALAPPPPPPPPLSSASPRLTLERVLGITSLSNAMVAVNPATGETAYAAGCIVVIYNLRRNKQVRYYRVEKSVACLCFSPSGQFLAIGEKGDEPAITIWDGADGTLCAELQRHRYGVACMAFSRGGRFLLSAGLVHDQQLVVWDLREAMRGPSSEHRDDDDVMRGKAVGVATVHEKILAIDYCQGGNFFVTVGEKHFKFWFLDDQDAFLLTGCVIHGVPEIQHRDAVMAAKTDATFTGVACGYGACRLKTFAVTSDGTLCCFGASCIMERLVSLEAAHGSAISVTEAYVAVAGSSSIVRLFDPSTLEYRATMPFPPPLGKANEPNDASSNILHPDEPHRYPSVLAVRVTGSHVIVLYSDRSLFIYDVSDTQNACVERSFLCHSGCIRDLQIAGRVRGVNAKGKLVYVADDGRRAGATAEIVPNGTFVTCSDDNTMRLWHLDLHKQQSRSSSGRFSGRLSETGSDASAVWKNPFSQEMLWITYHDDERDFAAEKCVVLGGTCSFDRLCDIHSPPADHGLQANGLCTVGIHPQQTQLVAGDKNGNLTVLQLPSALHATRDIQVHNAEVHCVAFNGGLDAEGPDHCSSLSSSSSSSSPCWMATGGSDRLVRVFDCRKAYAVVATLDHHHSSAVTTLRFTPDGKKLLSCGADKTVMVSEIDPDGHVTRLSSINASAGSKVLDMAVTSNNEFLITTCNNRLAIHSLSTGQTVASHNVGEQHRIDVCPANAHVAMSGSQSDKTIRVVDMATGETLADATGHGEAVTAVKFTPDCRRLVSASSDGCIFVWRLPEAIQSAIKAKLPRISEPGPGPLPVPPILTTLEPTHESQQSALLVPPPAPPVPVLKALRGPPHDSELSVLTAKTTLGASALGPTVTTASLPRKSVGKEAKSWKSKVATPAPGPMAKTPMEDWMRTRASAKKTVHVEGDASDNDGTLEPQVADDGVHLAIDRSQTPDWAKTVKILSETKETASMEERRLAGAKWEQQADPQLFQRESIDVGDADESEPIESGLSSDSDRIRDDDDDEAEADDLLFIRQQSGEVHQLDIPHSKEIARVGGGRRGSVAQDEQNVMNLSVGSLLDLQARGGVATSHSLALEREQLERRKKQIDTANAVAAMNTKLLQLGLLKPNRSSLEGAGNRESDSGSRPTLRASVGAETDVGPTGDSRPSSDNPRVELSSSDGGGRVDAQVDLPATTTPSRRADIPEELLQSIDIAVIPRVRGNNVSIDGLEQRHLGSANSVRVDASLSAFTTGFHVPTPGGRLAISHESVDVTAAAAVHASISSFTTGYTSRVDETDSVGIRHSGSLPPVSASLSAFTPGYSIDNHRVRAEHSPLPVDTSLSSFTSGFRAADESSRREAAASRTSIDVTSAGVNASISAFTTGYSNSVALGDAGGSESSSLSSVRASLSTFTSGYQSVASSTIASPINESSGGQRPIDDVSASLSVFTGGYDTQQRANEPTRQSFDASTGQSLSSFTSGYKGSEHEVSSRHSTPVPLKSATTSCTRLCALAC